MIENAFVAVPEGCLVIAPMDILQYFLFATGHSSHMIYIDSSLRQEIEKKVEHHSAVLSAGC